MDSNVKFDYDNIKNLLDTDEKFQEFLIVKKRKPSTILGYKGRITQYCLAIGLTPTEFIKEAESEEDAGIKLKKRKIKFYLMKFIQYLRNKGLRETSISNYLIYIKSFYNYFEVEIPKLPVKLESLPKKSYREWISKEDIKKALKYSNRKYRAIILLMASSGMGAAEIRSLKFADFTRSIKEYTKFPLKHPYLVEDIRSSLPSNQHIIPLWYVKRIKTGEYYYTFSSPESVEAILDYLEYRESKNKPVYGDEEPLFIGRYSNTIINPKGLSSAFERINDDIGFEQVGNKRYFTSHELRRFFSDQAFKAGLQERDVKWLRGQKPRDTLNRYVKPDPKKLKVEYMEKALPRLSIEEVKVREIEGSAYLRLKRLEQENEKLRKEKNNDSKELDFIKDKMEEMELKQKATMELLLSKGIRDELNKREETN